MNTVKYQGKRIRWNSVHVLVFANFHPDVSKLSIDRWDIRELYANEAGELECVKFDDPWAATRAYSTDDFDDLA